MARTIEGKAKQRVTSGAPASGKITLPERPIELHEMPDLTKEAPEVEYGQPRRTWLRYLAVGVTVGAVGIGAGLLITNWMDTGPEFSNAYSLEREHLAQAPGGFAAVPGTFSNAYSLEREHLAQAPGGFAAVPGTFSNAYSLQREHLAQAPGGFAAVPGSFSNAYSLEREHLAQAPGGFAEVPTQ